MPVWKRPRLSGGQHAPAPEGVYNDASSRATYRNIGGAACDLQVSQDHLIQERGQLRLVEAYDLGIGLEVEAETALE